ncbi:MAG TPA: aminotransferase class III-fold pyridoxal phosphate-dependent enzyme [Burkholderiaceae bacterium]|nr:aminotransferase class III-fold pyridoxal phosphate-dependent enzyme [Burkholderiaceae bacterium]
MGHADPLIEADARQHFWMPFSPNREFKAEPRMFVRGEGVWLYKPNGDRVIDASSGLFCVAAGHCRPEIAKAVYEQLSTLDYTMPFTRAHPGAFELARRVAAFTPEGLNRVFFTCSGSEAVDSAMKMALAYHRIRGQGHRQLFVSRERAYHGVNLGGVALSGMVNNRRTFGVGLPGVHFMRHTALPENRFVRGQPERGADLAEDLARICAMVGGDNVAAVFVEPTAGSFGCLPPPRGYLQRLREICDAHGILLVFDEVITGWGRMGAPFGAQAFGVTPDLLTMAKAITNGAQPLGAVAARQSIYDAITDAGPAQGIEFFHGYTYSAHPASCAAGLAMMDLFEREDLIGRAAALSPYFLDAVFSLRDLPCLVDIRGIGMMAALELSPGDRPPGARGHAAQKALYDANLNLKSTGDSLILAPAFVSERAHVDLIVDTLRRVLSTF